MTPDYKSFGEHLAEWDSQGIPYGNSDLVKLAKQYGTPLPGTPEWKKHMKELEEAKQIKETGSHTGNSSVYTDPKDFVYGSE